MDAKPESWLNTAGKRARYLVGVSGGADSVALLRLLLKHGFSNLVVCHLDHRLRGRFSTVDANFVRNLADQCSMPVEMGRADVKRLMSDNGGSLETVARNARHEFFAECSVKWNCRKVLLAHHADDQAETMLWNLLRGSHGWKGMRECNEMRIGSRRLLLIRPLLGFRRLELREYLTRIHQSWREDQSNSEGIAVRNRLRNEVLPLLDEIGGRDVVSSILRAAADDHELRAFVSYQFDLNSLMDPQGRVHCGALRKLAPFLQREAMAAFLMGCGIGNLDRKTLDAAVALLSPDAAPSVNLPGGNVLRRRQGRLFLA